MTLKACVLGSPVFQSLSPRLHGYWLERYRIPGRYDAIETKPDNLKSTLEKLRREGYAGCNLTMPLKEAALGLLDEVDLLAQKIGAVNTVVIRRDKSMLGLNTDAYGFIMHLKKTLPGRSFQKVLILGAGGAARAAITALQMEGVTNITVTNRTADKAQKLAQGFGCLTVPWEQRADALEGINLLVNTTSLGMTGREPLTLDLEKLSKSAVVYDIVYSPLVTPLLEDAQQRGNKTVTGLGMLLHQARPAFKAWFGHDPDVTPELERFIAGG